MGIGDKGLIPTGLCEIIEDFQLAEGREKLELLLEYSENLPEISKGEDESTDQLKQVHECMTPVYLRMTSIDRKLFFDFLVPDESPTIRGFAAILAEGLNGCSAEEIINLPTEFYFEMGLQQVLSHQRLNGISAILAYMKRLALEEMTNQST